MRQKRVEPLDHRERVAEPRKIDQPMFHVVLECEGLPTSSGPQAVVDVTEDFTQRPWQQNVSCIWDGKILRLEVDNDFDANGLASRMSSPT